MQTSVFPTAEGGMKTQKFLQGETRQTILGELHNRVVGREIERTIKLKTDINSAYIARHIYNTLKDVRRKEAFSLLRVGITRSMLIQTQYELDTHEKPFQRKITVTFYEKEQAAVKIKSAPVRKHKKVKVKEESKFFIPYINGKKPEMEIKTVLEENIPEPLKEGNSWKKEKYCMFVQWNKNIFTIAISQIALLKPKNNLTALQRTFPLRRIEVEYQGTLREHVRAQERKKREKQVSIEFNQKVESEIMMQIQRISQRVLKICTNEWCFPLLKG